MAAKTPTEDPKMLGIKHTLNAGNADGGGKKVNGGAAGEDSGGDSDDDADGHGSGPGNGAGLSGAAGEGGATEKKKKKRKPKKKKKAPTAQTDPPSVLVSQLFPNGSYPKGEEVEYVDENRYRTTDEEKRHLDSLNSDFLTDYRQAAETHRQVRQWAQKNIKPGQTLLEIADGIEGSVRRLLGHDGLAEGDAMKAGMGFPLGLNLDEIAAHYSPNAGNKTVLQQSNVMKVDIGVHVNGRIVDSAFTMAFDPTYDNLLAAVRDATDTGVREAGIDVRLGELGGLIQEAMESYECEIGGVTYPVKPIRRLAGHNILPYSIHGTKSVPLVRTDDTTKMEEGDVFAIETFGSTGVGRVVDQGEVSHYALRSDAPMGVDLRLSSAKSLLSTIKKNFGTLPFCRRYLDRIGQEKYLLGLNTLVKAGIVEDYPPLVEKKGAYTAQYEHTILLRPTVKEVISRGDDY
jgi:methionyl aminopeptidase